MTTHDDPNLLVLERELADLAAPQPGDERLRLTIRAELSADLSTRPLRRRTARVAVALSAIAGTVVAIGLLATIGPIASSGPSTADAAIVRHALAAVTPPPDKILYMAVVGTQNGSPVAAATWQQTSPPYAMRGEKGAPGHQGEFADNGTTSFAFDPLTNIILASADSSPPTFSDPAAQIRHELADGQAVSTGTVVIGGSRLYRIVLPHGLVGYFGAGDFRPRYLDDPQRDGSVVRLRVAAYEYLPLTRSNRALLSITAQHPDARVTAAPPGTRRK